MTREEAIKLLSQIMGALLVSNSWLPSTDNPIKEAFGMAISALQAQESCNNLATDTISRQAAIDIERRATVDTNPKHFESHQKFMEFMDDAEISSFGRWQWSNGFNTALTAVGIDLKGLPSADRTGEWEHDVDGHFFCTNCKKYPEYQVRMSDYCPNCGADMRGEQDE